VNVIICKWLYSAAYHRPFQLEKGKTESKKFIQKLFTGKALGIIHISQSSSIIMFSLLFFNQLVIWKSNLACIEVG